MSDMIDRRAAIRETWREPTYSDPLNVLTEVRDRIEALPSAQPERKKGQWITHEVKRFDECHTGRFFDECSECGKLTPEWRKITEYHRWYFCPNCGAEMEVEK